MQLPAIILASQKRREQGDLLLKLQYKEIKE